MMTIMLMLSIGWKNGAILDYLVKYIPPPSINLVLAPSKLLIMYLHITGLVALYIQSFYHPTISPLSQIVGAV